MRALQRAGVALATAAVTLLVCEGLFSFAGRSLRPGAAEVRWAGPSALDEDALAALRTSPGLYRPHADPRVGYVMKRDKRLAIHDGEIHTDQLGMRRPPEGRAASVGGLDASADGGEASSEDRPLSVVVLGDSVAFGFGLDDDEVLAARLAALLTPALGREVTARTVAQPGWNARNAVSFLLDHLDVYAPDLVVYMPVGNDLADTDGVYETGHRRVAVDPFSPDPRLHVQSVRMKRFQSALAKRRGELADRPGAAVLRSDVAPFAQQRFEDNVDALERLVGRLGATPVVVADWRAGPYGWTLRDRLAARGLELPWIPLLLKVPPGGTLGFDPHPNARTIDGIARWLAADLVALGFVGAAAASVPDAPEAMAPFRCPPRPLSEARALVDGQRRSERGQVQAVVDFGTGRGTSQVVGFVRVDGVVGSGMAVLLDAAGAAVRVELGGLAHAPRPVPVDVEIGGEPVGRLVVPPGALAEGTFVIPAGARTEGLVEVSLLPADWWVGELVGEHRREAFRPLRLVCE